MNSNIQVKPGNAIIIDAKFINAEGQLTKSIALPVYGYDDEAFKELQVNVLQFVASLYQE